MSKSKKEDKSKETSKKGRLKDDDIVKSDFLNCKVDANLTKEEQVLGKRHKERTRKIICIWF